MSKTTSSAAGASTAWRASLAACLVGGGWFATAWVAHPPGAIDPSDGAKIFENRCARCHAADPSLDLGYGPGLAEIGRQAAHRRPGMDAEDYLFEAILQPGAFRTEDATGVMPPAADGLSPGDVANLVAYLMTLGHECQVERVAAASARVDWDAASPEAVAPVDFARAEAGRQIYLGRGRCVQCHPLQRLPGHTLQGPSLLSVGHHDEQYLRDAIRDPSRKINAGYQESHVELASGHALVGRLLGSAGERRRILVTGDQTLRVVDLDPAEVASEGTASRPLSSMPAPHDLSDEDVESLVAFLKTLKY